MLNIKLNLKNMMMVALGVIAFSVTAQVQADGAGAFLGGIAVAKIGSSVRDQRDYEEDQAYYAQQQAEAAQRQADAAQSRPQTTEEKLAQLDTLAANGYISREEYQSRKQAILDDM